MAHRKNRFAAQVIVKDIKGDVALTLNARMPVENPFKRDPGPTWEILEDDFVIGAVVPNGMHYDAVLEGAVIDTCKFADVAAEKVACAFAEKLESPEDYTAEAYTADFVSTRR